MTFPEFSVDYCPMWNREEQELTSTDSISVLGLLITG